MGPETQLWTDYLDVTDIYMLPSVKTAQRLSFILHKKARMDGRNVPLVTHADVDTASKKLFMRCASLDVLNRHLYLQKVGDKRDYWIAQCRESEATWPYFYNAHRTGTPEEIHLNDRLSAYLREKLPQKAVLECCVGQDTFCILENVSKFYWEKVVARMLPDFDCGERRVTWVAEDVDSTVNVLLWISYRERESIPWETWEEAFTVP